MTTPKLSTPHLRILVIAIWVAATVAAGMGAGLLIRANSRQTSAGEAPNPVATANVGVSNTPSSDIARAFAGAPLDTPRVVTDSSEASIYQAQASQSTGEAVVVSYQYADNSDALQPGFTHFGLPQGTKGTDAVH